MFQPQSAEMPAGSAPMTAADALERLARLAATATGLAAPLRASGSWTGAERAQALRTLDRVAGALASARAGLLVAEARAETSVRPGDRDFAAARARQTRTGLGDAKREVRQAETLVALPPMADAVSAGRVPLPHVDALARVAETTGDRGRAMLQEPDVATRLVGMAQRLSVREFASAAARMLAAADPTSLERGVDAQRRERFFVMSHQPEGTFLKGRLDRLAAETLRVALASVRQAPDDERDKRQADADALVALAERASSGMAGVRARRTSPAGGLLPDLEQDAADATVSGTAGRPTLSVLVPAETFVEVREAQRRRDAGAVPESEIWWRPVEPATLEDGTPVAMSQLGRLLCDSEIGRIVMSADGLPLDVGRAHRVYTAAQRKAIVVRDRTCAWNGCDVPAAFCEIHHIRWWDRDGGPTDLDNGILLCSHHHHAVHRLDLAIDRLGSAPVAPPMLGEPVRYRFRRRGGGVVNAPPDVGQATDLKQAVDVKRAADVKQGPDVGQGAAA